MQIQCFQSWSFVDYDADKPKYFTRISWCVATLTQPGYAQYNIHQPARYTDADLRTALAGIRIARAEFQQWSHLHRCAHSFDIRDRFEEGAGLHQLWIQQDLVTHRCTARYLIPIARAILTDYFPRSPPKDLAGTLVLSRRKATLVDVVTHLVHEVTPYLAVDNLAITFRKGGNSPEKLRLLRQYFPERDSF